MPRGTCAPAAASSSFAWYSWIFMSDSQRFAQADISQPLRPFGCRLFAPSLHLTYVSPGRAANRLYLPKCRPARPARPIRRLDDACPTTRRTGPGRVFITSTNKVARKTRTLRGMWECGWPCHQRDDTEEG